MKILIVSTALSYGGGESFILNTLVKLSIEKYYIVAFHGLLERLGEEVTEMFLSKSIFHRSIQINKVIQREKIDCVLLNGGSAIYFAPFIHKCSIIIYRHTTNKAVLNPFKRIIYISLLHFCYAFADKIISVSRYANQEQKLFRKKGFWIHHGVVPIPYKIKFTKKPIKLLYVGRLEQAKGIDLIIQAVKCFNENEIHLDIVGDGVLRPYIERLNVKNITYHGFSNDPSAHYSNNDIFLSLPTHEAFGLTFIEAMNHSMPVIGCNTGALPEIIKNGTNGYLIERNVDNLCLVLRQFIKTPGLVRTMGLQSNYICAEKFNINSVIYQIEDIINK